jgi:hypothetical protein
MRFSLDVDANQLRASQTNRLTFNPLFDIVNKHKFKQRQQQPQTSNTTSLSLSLKVLHRGQGQMNVQTKARNPTTAQKHNTTQQRIPFQIGDKDIREGHTH